MIPIKFDRVPAKSSEDVIMALDDPGIKVLNRGDRIYRKWRVR